MGDTPRGDGCSPPASLKVESFDLVYCNSVIEHVGGHERRIALAETIQRFAPHHWVQTPDRYTPIEPHIMAPFFQFMPLWMRAEVLRYWPFGTVHTTYASVESPQTALGRSDYPVSGAPQPLRSVARHYAQTCALSIELLSRTELQWLFPRSEILAERMAGLPKSIIAVTQ